MYIGMSFPINKNKYKIKNACHSLLLHKQVQYIKFQSNLLNMLLIKQEDVKV